MKRKGTEPGSGTRVTQKPDVVGFMGGATLFVIRAGWSLADVEVGKQCWGGGMQAERRKGACKGKKRYGEVL